MFDFVAESKKVISHRLSIEFLQCVLSFQSLYSS